MRKIGLEAAFLYVAALISFLVAAYKPEWARTAKIIAALCFVVATVMLLVKTVARKKNIVG